MPLTAPNLDDRTFKGLVTQALNRVRRSCPEWTDLGPSDPGAVLLEAFGFLTEQMIYRLNRLPDKAYMEFLRLIGLRMQPPSAAGVKLRFSVEVPAPRAIDIPRGTRVTVKRQGGGAEPPVFATARAVTIPAGGTSVEVLAHHVEIVAGEPAGKGGGLPGLWITARRPPIVAPLGNDLDLVVGIEAGEDELDDRVPAVEFQGKAYRLWREVENFTDLGGDKFVYVADRLTGTIMFAPALARSDSAKTEALAEVPPEGREIRLWYCRGGGPEGNVAAGVLDTLKDPIPLVKVTNPAAAAGGRAAETLENALIRGPQELHSLKRAVTAGDFELIAKENHGAVVRAKAFTKASLWKHAAPGTVEVLLVPNLPDDGDGGQRVGLEKLKERQTEEARQHIQRVLDERRPLGTDCQVSWVRYKPVRAEAKVVVHREEDPKAVEKRLLARLNQIINPLPTKLRSGGWPFGEPLRAFHVYETVRAEPGVSYVENINFVVDEVPGKNVRSVSQDQFQPRTWYAVAGDTLFRSTDDGAGWVVSGKFPGEEALLVRVHGKRAGLLAVVTRIAGEKPGARVHVSSDCGESWTSVARTEFRIEDLAWTIRDDAPLLYLATEKGLYELALRADRSSVPVQVLVDPKEPSRGFNGVVVADPDRGGRCVAVAGSGMAGVFLSSDEGRSQSFRMIGMKGEDVRVLAVEYAFGRCFLWAGTAAAGENDAGKGCFRWEIFGHEDSPEGWRRFSQGWKGGSVKALAFMGSTVLAATFSAGVLALPSAEKDPVWQAPDFVQSRLPLRDQNRLQTVEDLAVDPDNRLILAAGPEGVYGSENRGRSYRNLSEQRFDSAVTLPATWLFCSAEHQITVVSEDEAGRH